MKAKNHSTKKDDELKDIIEQTVLLNEPDRSKKLESLIAISEDLAVKRKLKLILERVNLLGLHIEGFLPEEIIDFQNDIVRNLYHLLDHEHFIEYLRYNVRNLTEICNDQKDLIERNKGNMMWYAREGAPIHSWFSRSTRKIQWLEKVIVRFTQNKLNEKQFVASESKLTNEVVAGFCNIVNASNLHPRQDNETIVTYCQRICKMYNFPYKDRISKDFSQAVNASLASNIQTRLLPTILEKDRAFIIDYMNKEIVKK